MCLKSCKFVIVLFVIIFSSLLLISCAGGKLTEEKAKNAVNLLLAQGAKLPDNSPNPATLIEWQGLVQISEGEMHGKAIIQHKDGKMDGKFIFHKTSEGKWVIDKVEFRGVGFNFWNSNVFQKVE